MFSGQTIAMIQEDLGFDELEVKSDTDERVWGYIYDFRAKLRLSIEIDKLEKRFLAMVITNDREKRFGFDNYRLTYASPVVRGAATKGIAYISKNIRSRLLIQIADTHKREIEKISLYEANKELSNIFCEEIAKDTGLKTDTTGRYIVSATSRMSPQSVGVRLELNEYITINPENVKKIEQLKSLLKIIRQIKGN